MGWNEQEFLESLTAAVERFDRELATKLCNAVVAALEEGALPSEMGAKSILQALRRKCYFDLMEGVADALRLAGRNEPQIRRQHAQSLIDQGKTSAALDLLELLVTRTADDPAENAEARGLLGRIYKQLYVNAVNADRGAAGLKLHRLNLERAVAAYHEVYLSAPAVHLWHGINTVALVVRAQKDGVPLAEPPNPEDLARRILTTIEEIEEPQPWDMATAVEACVALGDPEKALVWMARYVQQKEADAFELSSTERQLREVWGLTIHEPPGALLLPLLQSQILGRKGGRVDLSRNELAPTIQGTRELERKLEKVFGAGGFVSVRWFRNGLERCQNVAQVQTLSGAAHGTGFLIRGRDLDRELGDELLLLTNAHVISDDPAVLEKGQALRPGEVLIVFEELKSAAEEHRVAELLWTSGPDDLDGTLVRLDPPLEGAAIYPLAAGLPVLTEKQGAYVIGHPGGRQLSFSLDDNLLLDYDDRLLHYRSPTEPGSSGSPVFNQHWELIGLHHAGRQKMPRLKGEPGTYEANEGIQIQRIAAAVSEHLRKGPTVP